MNEKHLNNTMIIMNIKADNLFALNDFNMCMSYKDNKSDYMLPGEYLENCPKFKYKKVNIIMGGNATGKTSIGRLLMSFANYFKTRSIATFLDAVNDTSRPAELQIDFVTDQDTLYRFHFRISPEEMTSTDLYQLSNDTVKITATQIGTDDDYESCAFRLSNGLGTEINVTDLNTCGCYFTYQQDAYENKICYSADNTDKYLHVLSKVIKTMDPSVKEVIKSYVIENTYVIKYADKSVVIKDGKLLVENILSSGTKAGIDISYVIASMLCNMHSLYYCDELFSYVNSDIEKACLGLMIRAIHGRKQLFFTTHNTDILDIQLPKHSYTFLKKETEEGANEIKCIYASDYLADPSESLRCAVENDLFCTAPNIDELYRIIQ